MYCQACGMEVASSYKICPKCGGKNFSGTILQTTISSKASSPIVPPQFSQGANPSLTGSSQINGNANLGGYTYATFWRRLGALFVDGVLITAIRLGLIFLPAVLSGADPEQAGTMTDLFSFPFVVLYFAFMESSKQQGTLGKKIFGLRVVDLSGQRLSFWKAFRRYFGRVVSGIILGIGFLMIFFSERRQALHDRMAGTYVLYVGK